VHTLINKVFSEPRYYLYGVLIVIAAFILLFLFGIQTGTSSGGGPR
jgi:VIT1/CCC1 family predicted Fe2+/Mn2+ transporter